MSGSPASAERNSSFTRQLAGEGRPPPISPSGLQGGGSPQSRSQGGGSPISPTDGSRPDIDNDNAAAANRKRMMGGSGSLW
jgi:hypothetical protein